MRIKEHISKWLNSLSVAKMEKSRSKSILLYCSFLLISAFLWGFLTFNNNVTLDIPFPVKLVDTPERVHFITHVPDTITVTVTGRGTSFLKYLFKSPKPIELKFDDYASSDYIFRVDAMQLKKLIKRQLGMRSNIAATSPESINCKYTDLPGKLVPVIIDIDVQPQLLYMQNGSISKSADSVLVYSDQATLDAISEVYTYHIKAHDLTDTLVRRVSIAPLRGAVVEPRSIDVVVPVEKMVSQRHKVQIAVRNVPDGFKVVVFPSTLEVSYRAPQSKQLANPANDVTVVVDYNNIVSSHSNKVPVQVGEAPAVYQDIRLSEDSVEFIVEKLRVQ